MSFIEFQTKWVDTLPTIGIQCETCKEGFVEDNSFTDKKGKQWNSVKCKHCATKWIMSSHTPKSPTAGQFNASQGTYNEVPDLLKKISRQLDEVIVQIIAIGVDKPNGYVNSQADELGNPVEPV